MSEEEKNKEIMENCVRMAQLGVDIEQLWKDIKPVFEAIKPVIDLSIKNYNFIKGFNQNIERIKR